MSLPRFHLSLQHHLCLDDIPVDFLAIAFPTSSFVIYCILTSKYVPSVSVCLACGSYVATSVHKRAASLLSLHISCVFLTFSFFPFCMQQKGGLLLPAACCLSLLWFAVCGPKYCSVAFQYFSSVYTYILKSYFSKFFSTSTLGLETRGTWRALL